MTALFAHRPIDRRTFLRKAVGGAAALAAPSLLAGCGGGSAASYQADAAPWRRYAGTTLNFISENTSPTAAIAANKKPFTDLTGINLNIVQLELSALVQKVALDFASGSAAYQVIYADPYQVLAPYAKGLYDLRGLMGDANLPQPKPGLSDFIPTQLDAAGRFIDKEAVYALPYDCPTLIWQYRADLFAKHKDAMSNDLGFDPTPSGDRTWEEYYRIAAWFNKKAHADVPFGAGHQAKQHDSLMNDFSNVLWAYGGDYFEHGTVVGRLGSRDPGPSQLTTDAAMEAAGFYRKLLKVAHPSSTTWDWDGLGSALRAGQIAMCPNWHEYAASNETALPGKIDYAPLPKGPARRAGMYGGTGLGINANCSRREREAAWLFLVWATAPKTQLANLASKAGGGTPTRQSVYDLPEVHRAKRRPSKLPNILTAPAVFETWKPQNIGLRPKIPMWNECDTIIFTQLSDMLVAGTSPRATLVAAKVQLDRTVARGWAT